MHPIARRKLQLLTQNPKLPTSGLMWASVLQQGSDSQVIYDVFNNNGYRGSTSSSDVNDPPWLTGGGLGSDAVDDYSTLPASILTSNNLTIVAVLKAGSNASSNYRYFGARFGTQGMALLRNTSSQLIIAQNAGSNTFLTPPAGATLSSNEYAMFAHTITRSTGQTNVSKNGQPQQSYTGNVGIGNAPTECYLGASDVKTVPWNGEIHFFAVYNYRLSDSEIAAIYRFAQWLMRQRGVNLP